MKPFQSSSLFGFREMEPDQCIITPKLFSNPDELDRQLAESQETSPNPSKLKSLYQYHNKFKNNIMGTYVHDREMFGSIERCGQLIRDNHLKFATIRRTTLIIFLAVALLIRPNGPIRPLYETMPLNGESGIYAFLIWFFLYICLFAVLSFLNTSSKKDYRHSIKVSSANLSNCIQFYNSQLHDNGFRKCIDLINDEEAKYGAGGRSSIWPERAQKWTILAYDHFKRSEQLERYTEVSTWETRRFMDFLHRVTDVVDFCILAIFTILGVWLSYADFRLADVSHSMEALSPVVLNVIGLLFVLGAGIWGWWHRGWDEINIFYTSLLSEDMAHIWKRSADLKKELAYQVFKDKSRIQRERRNPNYDDDPHPPKGNG